MYTLVQFLEDQVYYICNSKHIRRRKSVLEAKWEDNNYYPATIITSSSDNNILHSFLRNLELGYPKLILQKCEDIIEAIGSFCNDDPFQTDEDSSYIPSSSRDTSSDDSLYQDNPYQTYQDPLHKPGSSMDISYEDLAEIIQPTFDSETKLKSDNEKNLELCMFCGQMDYDLRKHVNKYHPDDFIGNFTEADKGHEYPSKQHFCLYCGVKQSKLARHLQRKHANEDKVNLALRLPLGSAERKAIYSEIQKLGDFQIYKKSLDKSQFISVRRAKIASSKTVPCPYCKGFYSKKNLRNHVNLNCTLKSRAELVGTGSNLQIEGRKVLPKVHPKANDEFKKYIYPKMRDDEITCIAVNDELTVIYINLLIMKYSTSTHHHKEIRTKLRQIGRMLREIRKNNNKIAELKDLFSPEYYDDYVKAVHNLGGLENGKYRTPSVAPAYCTLMTKIGSTLICELIKKGDSRQKETVENFLFLLKNSQCALMTKVAIENRTQYQRSKIETLPTTKDVNILFNRLTTEIGNNINILQSRFDLVAWKKLNKLNLVQIMIFNRKRPGDIEKSQIVEFNNLQQVDGEMVEKLNDAEKEYASNFSRYISRGKLDKPAPILISNINRDAINLTLRHRSDAQVLNTNQYIFGTPDGSVEPYFKAGLALREFCIAMSLPSEKLTATKLRKHLVTNTCTLSQGEQLVISDFMGHAFDIHNNIYRQRSLKTDIIQMGKVLTEAAGTSNLNEMRSTKATDFNIESSDSEECDVHEHDTTLDEHSQYQPDLSIIIESPDPTHKEFETVKKRTRMFPKSTIGTIRRTWRTPERKIIRDMFSYYLENNILPSASKCQDILNENKLNILRTPQQIRNWICAEIKRKGKNKEEIRHGWTTPVKMKCRSHFTDFYKTGIYPSLEQLEWSIHNIQELSNTTVSKLRSHLQHDKKYIEQNVL